jgi:peptide/nickel transport system permease protein
MSEVTLRETLVAEEHPADVTPEAAAAPEERVREFRPGRGFWLATGWMALLVVIALFVDVLPFQNPLTPDPRNTGAGPSLEHWFGTDTLGRDLLARSAHGARISLLVAFLSSVVAAAVGSLFGFLAGYVRGRTERVVMSAMDVMLAFPTLIFALALVAFLGASTRNVIIAIAVVAVPVFARLVRAQTLTYGEREFVVASRATGATDRRTLLTEIAPNVAPSILAFALVLAALAIVIEGGLSFLGLGVPLPTPAWGNIIASGQRELDTAPHVSLIPGILMFLTVLALNTAGERLRVHFEGQDGRR